MKRMIYFMFFLGVLGGQLAQCTGASNNRCSLCKNDIEHPQTKICTTQFAFLGTIIDWHKEPEVYMEYDVLIDTDLKTNNMMIFKGKDILDEHHVDHNVVKIQTPISRLCGLELEIHEHFLFTGMENDDGSLEYIICDWVEPWNNLTDYQQKALTDGTYLASCEDTDCQVLGSRTGNTNLDWKEMKDGCPFHPVEANIQKVDDCETKYSTCEKNNNICSWNDSPEYEKCYASRVEKAGRVVGEAALSLSSEPLSKAECKSKYETDPKGKKKCLRNLYQYKKYQKEVRMNNILLDIKELETLEEEEHAIEFEIENIDNSLRSREVEQLMRFLDKTVTNDNAATTQQPAEQMIGRDTEEADFLQELKKLLENSNS